MHKGGTNVNINTINISLVQSPEPPHQHQWNTAPLYNIGPSCAPSAAGHESGSSMQHQLHSFQRRATEAELAPSPTKRARFAQGTATWHHQSPAVAAAAAAVGRAALDVPPLSNLLDAGIGQPPAHTVPHPSTEYWQGGFAYLGPDIRQGEAPSPFFSSQLQAGAGSLPYQAHPINGSYNMGSTFNQQPGNHCGPPAAAGAASYPQDLSFMPSGAPWGPNPSWQPQAGDGLQPRLFSSSYDTFNEWPGNPCGPPASAAPPQDTSFMPSGAPWAPNPFWSPSPQVQTFQGAVDGPGTGSMLAAGAPGYGYLQAATVQDAGPISSSGMPFAPRPLMPPPLPAPPLPGNPADQESLQQLDTIPELTATAPPAAATALQDTWTCATPTFEAVSAADMPAMEAANEAFERLFGGSDLTGFWGDHVTGLWGDHLSSFLGDHLSMLPLDPQVALLGMDSNSRPTSEAVEVVMGEWLAGIGGYGVAMLLKLLMGTACMGTPTSY